MEFLVILLLPNTHLREQDTGLWPISTTLAFLYENICFLEDKTFDSPSLLSTVHTSQPWKLHACASNLPKIGFEEIVGKVSVSTRGPTLAKSYVTPWRTYYVSLFVFYQKNCVATTFILQSKVMVLLLSTPLPWIINPQISCRCNWWWQSISLRGQSSSGS